MHKLIEKTLNAKRESKYIEFKEMFDPSSTQEWCEIIKDIVAISNSGGGTILFGVDNKGIPKQSNLNALVELDPADIANKMSKYVGTVEIGIQVSEVCKGEDELVIFIIDEAETPIVFNKPGTYPVESGKQKTAFSQGVIYFRHGAKSEPGNTEDLRRALDMKVARIRGEWMKSVRKVVSAPQGSHVVLMSPPTKDISGQTTMIPIKAVADPSATPVYLTRDKSKATGIFMHEELDERLFDEINNVMGVNNLLAGDTKEFVLGEAVYYRIYAERQHIERINSSYTALLRNAFSKQYVPYMYWCIRLPASEIASVFAQQYRHPKSPYITSMLRAATCLHDEFISWLFEKMTDKWKGHPQPPAFYWATKKIISQRKRKDYRLVAVGQSKDTQIVLKEGHQIKLSALLEDSEQASDILSKKCLEVYGGNRELRKVTRELDVLAYGQALRNKSSQILKGMKKLIGDELPGDPPAQL